MLLCNTFYSPSHNTKQTNKQTKIQQKNRQRRIKTRIHWLDRRIVRKQLGIIPTYHYVQNQGNLMIQSPENDQKPQFGNFFDNFEV